MEVVDVWTGGSASALRMALRMSNESFAAHLGAAVRTVANWEASLHVVPSPTMQAVLDTALEQAPATAQARFASLRGQQSSDLAVLDPTFPEPGEQDGILDSARTSATDAALRAGRVSDAVDAVRSQLSAIARRYSHRSPIDVFADSRELRDVTYRLAERTHRPSELADLYVVAGGTNALMGSIAFDLGHWDAARTLVEAATTYAEIAGHRSLEAWTWGLQATLANWRAEPETARSAYERGIVVAPAGASSFRLHHIAARTKAAEGDAAAVSALTRVARDDLDALDTTRDELQHEIGGEFAFEPARAAACEAAAWLELRDGQRAEEEATQALALYTKARRNAQPYSPINGTRIDVAAARLLRRDLDGASEVLEPVLALEPTKRNAALTGRIIGVRHQLDAPEWTRTSDARDLTAQIDEWTSDTAAAPHLADEFN